MADTIDPATLVKETLENITDSEAGKKILSSPEGRLVAYSSLVIMAMLPIFVGSLRSVKHQKQQKQKVTKFFNENEDATMADFEASGKKPDVMSLNDAMQFPIIASVALFGFYMAFKIFSKENINLVLTSYFFVLGVLALSHLLSPVIGSLIPLSVPNIPFHVLFTRGEGKKKSNIIDYKFSTHDIVCLIFSAVISVWYLIEKHWVANNLLGIAFAVNGIELLHLNNIVTGAILLSGLFVYDIFWVFGTNVMVTVAKNFDAPIKLVFPQDILENGLGGQQMAMLGLGDIVIPGIFIALLLRFDNSLKRKSKIYFYATFIAYFLGLVATTLVMHIFKHAQPALLYLVPFCLLTPILVAGLKGEFKQLFAYEDFASVPNAIKNDKDTSSAAESSSTTKSKQPKKQKEAKKAK